jgi:hypothetical protein
VALGAVSALGATSASAADPIKIGEINHDLAWL